MPSRQQLAIVQCFIHSPKQWGVYCWGSTTERRSRDVESPYRRQDRDAEDVEGVRNGEKVSPFQPTRGSGGAP